MSIVLAVDFGRTGCRATLWTGADATPPAEAKGAGSVGLTAADGPAVAERAILAVVAPLLARTGVTHVDHACVGAPGMLTAMEAARHLAHRLVASLPARHVAVTSDAITSHAGALAGEPGVVLAAGTGAVVIAIGPAGAFRRVDGWGPWLGDEGSGAWIGREGLRAAARAEDGRGPATPLLAAARTQFGTLADLAARLGADPNPARTVATFAPAVALAARQRDAVATRILHAAAAALADSIAAGAAALGAPDPIPVAIVGGLADMGDVLLEPLHAALERCGTKLRTGVAQGTSGDGARWLATHADGIHEPWIVRMDAAASRPATATP